ncbi:hypothetical protein JAO29_07605 [Edaphobacter sp. HDX4]|uniref:hypothetical protein n=1 Tax=Edaphobacter sp. HDX4 TaxID=2794064 RepID=UPI002FE69926
MQEQKTRELESLRPPDIKQYCETEIRVEYGKPSEANQEWALDFAHDVVAEGRTTIRTRYRKRY